MTASARDGRRRAADQTSRRGGPRTSAGKARAARNAMRFGLSLPVLADPATAAAVESLMRRMSPTADAALGELARAVAEAQVDLVRIRRVRHDLIAAMFKHVAGGEQDAVTDGSLGVALAQILNDLPHLAVQLTATDRYERRALSRRKFAIRAFSAARAAHAK
jgi:hypothetical protein